MCRTNILSLRSCRYVKQISDSQCLWTPLAQLIKQNICDEWTRSQSRLPRVNLFSAPFMASDWTREAIRYEELMSVNTISYADDLRQSIGHSLRTNTPFAIVRRFYCRRDESQSNSFWNRSKFDCLLFALFCPNKHTNDSYDSLNWFQSLQGKHNQWWRNLSKSPLKSKFSPSIKEISDLSAQQWTLDYVSESQAYQLETISYLSESVSLNKLGINDANIIWCCVDLDNALSAILCDAYTERTLLDQTIQKIMQFNLSLAPFKIAFTFRENTDINEDLIDLTNYLIQCLKEFGVSIYPFSSKEIVSIHKFDELGIIYNVILDNSSPQNGVVFLRNRDSDIEESIHVSKFRQLISFYLKIVHPTDIYTNIKSEKEVLSK